MKKRHFSWGLYLVIALAWTGLETIDTAANAQENHLSEQLYKQIGQGCLRGMETKVVQPNVAKAYCYCYTETLSEWLTEEDFTRMDQYGISEHDRDVFKRARQRCHPSKLKKKKTPVPELTE